MGDDNEIMALCRHLHQKRLEDARQLDDARLLAGPQLFDMAARWTCAGIRQQYPGISEPEVLEKLRERIRFAERLEIRHCPTTS